MKRFVLCVLSLFLMLTSCGKKNDPYAPLLPSLATEHPEEEMGRVGTNEAFTFSPCEGMKVSVPENALYEDTDLRIEPVREETPHIREIIEDFYEQDMFALRAWEIDAGLEGNECLPGTYEVALDLDELGIPDSLRDSLSLYRVSDEGVYSELISSVEGNKLIYSSRQNSIEMLLYSTRKTLVRYYTGLEWDGLDILELKTRSYYWEKFATEGSFWYTTEVTTDNGSFNVTWTYDDLDPDHAAKAKRMAEISETYKKAIQNDTVTEKRSSWDVFGLFSKGKTEAELLKQALENDTEYQKLVKEYDTPKLLDQIISYISLSFYFLKKHEKIEMPESAVNYYLLTDMDTIAHGTSSWSWGSQAFIEINMRDVKTMVKEDAEGITARENLLLTVTHELFHVCQENYHTHFFSDSVRFDEMTAVVLESDARDYYYDNGIISVKPPLTDQNHWKRLEKSTDDNSLDRLMQTEQGYNLSLYYIYLREKEGKAAPVSEILNARSYFEKPKTSKILSEVFGLTEEQYQKRWFGFCKKYRKEAASLNQGRNIVEANKGIHFDLMNTEDYAMRIVGLEQKIKTPMPLLVIPDNISTVSDQRASYLPAVNYTVYKKGYYIPAQEGSKVDSSNNRRHMIEIYGKQDGEQMPGYTVYGFGQTPKARIDINRNKDRIEIYMPEESQLARDKLVEGYFIKVDADSGFKAQGHKTLEEMEKGIGVSFNKIYNGDDTKDVGISVTVCEYVSDNEGNHYYGIESQATDYTLKAKEEEEEEILNVDAEPISDEDQFLSSMSFGYPLDMILYEATHTTSTNYDSSFHDHIVEAYDEIAKTLIDKELHINGNGSFSFSLPLTSASSHWETTVNPDCYADVTSSFAVTGHIAFYEELDSHGKPREEDIDYGFPVIDSGTYSGSVKAFRENPMNGDSKHRYYYVLDIAGNEAELSEWQTSCDSFTMSRYYKELEKYGLEEDQEYLKLEMNIKFKVRWKGTLDEEFDASGWMEAHDWHSDRDLNVTESYILRFVSKRPISRYKREVYEGH